MSAKTAQEILGYEYDWLATDSHGHVAMFSTAGGGYAPKCFLADTDGYDEALDALKNLPATTIATQAPPVAAGLVNLWKLLAERGVFSYDSTPGGGPYQLVGVPAVPLRVTELAPSIAQVVQRLCLSRVELGKAAVITEDAIAQSEAADDR
jgi:hypothetical protein